MTEHRVDIKELLHAAEEARLLFGRGEISSREAIDRIQPYATAFNERSKAMANEANKGVTDPRLKVHHKPFSITGFLR